MPQVTIDAFHLGIKLYIYFLKNETMTLQIFHLKVSQKILQSTGNHGSNITTKKKQSLARQKERRNEAKAPKTNEEMIYKNKTV